MRLKFNVPLKVSPKFIVNVLPLFVTFANLVVLFPNDIGTCSWNIFLKNLVPPTFTDLLTNILLSSIICLTSNFSEFDPLAISILSPTAKVAVDEIAVTVVLLFVVTGESILAHVTSAVGTMIKSLSWFSVICESVVPKLKLSLVNVIVDTPEVLNWLAVLLYRHKMPYLIFL